ncbi:MAG: peptidylprolyl isomerase [Planctomycetota bacterium]|nr:peptidylprolyl isomerase [Planctomycetota bacterium]
MIPSVEIEALGSSDRQSPGLLVHRGLALGLLCAGWLAGCAGTPRVLEPQVELPAPIELPVTRAPQEPRPLVEYSPDILLPDPEGSDAEVARVGDLVLRQSHAFARLLSADPKLALSAVDLMVFDVLVAQHARQFGITVSKERVRELADQEEKELREQVAAELGDQITFSDYVWRIFGMRLPAWQRTAELRIAQRLYQGYVIRYLALREDRVRVRYMANKDRSVLEDAAIMVRQGADFATLALRRSTDSQRREGGLLPPFGEGFPHPVTDEALKLEPGQLSPVFERTAGGATVHYLVYCLEQLPGRSVSFEEVRDEVDRGLVDKPLSRIETNAYTLRWRGAGDQ